MRRILHIIDSLQPTDTAKQLLLLTQGLAAGGFDVHVVTLDSRGTLAGDFLAAGIPVMQLGRRWPIDPVAFIRFERLLFRVRPDLVHTWDFTAGLHGRIAARLAGTGRFISSHNRLIPSMGEWDWFVERRLARMTERLVVSSRWMREWCLEHSLPADKLAIIPPGAPNLRDRGISREELLAELKLPADAKLIGVIGRLVPENCVKDLIWAADLLRVLHDELRLLIVGDGPLRTQLEEYARLASNLVHIQFLGERGNTCRITPHLDVLWNASENVEFSASVLEAMAAGVPVIASDTLFNRELVVEGETGYLIPLGTRAGRAARARHTDRILTDATLARRLSSAARQRIADRFSLEQMVQKYTELFLA
ncbi:MAG TPA: glycosyltransferase [Lacipirellulaceae bacterium]|nr:glycosyltransferase [Lacipirellulaceae bacterium]